MCIRPYPKELEEWVSWNGQPILLRPIKPEDAAEHVQFFNALDPADIRYRTFMSVRELTPAQITRSTQIDFDREMAFVATRRRQSGPSETLGVVRCVADPDNQDRAEFAIIVRSDLKRKGLGFILLKKLIDYARNRAFKELFGDTLADNRSLIELVKRFGFRVNASHDGGWTLPLVLSLRADVAPTR